jgi:threonine/homoserine/homoserine lactone efflux protein
MTASMLGLGALLATSADLFTLLRWIGGLYLIYLGIKLWRAPVPANPAEPQAETSAGRMFAHAYAVTALNPKSIVFFIAFVPQFLVSTSPFWQQALILEASFIALSTLNASLYALLAASARQRLRQPRVRRIMNRAGGSMLMGAGALALSLRNANV